MNQYLLKKQIDFGNSIRNCKKIYLDINFWVKLRDQETDADKELFNKLEELVADNKCVLPISETIFYEILKQNDVSALKKMANVISKFSKGISIVSDQERQQLEFINFVHAKTQKPIFDMRVCVWTKISINIIYNMLIRFEPEKADNRFIDFLEDISFEKIITLADNPNFKPFKFKDNVAFLNKAKEKYKDENKSFKQMYLSELGGYLETFDGDFIKYMDDIYFLETGKHLTSEEKEKVHFTNWSLCIYNLVKLNKIKTALPSFTIFSELNASIRWNKDRKYSDGNDTFDFMHATAALPYYDYFFTEKELKTIIEQRKLDKIYNCVVLSEVNTVIKELESIH